MLLPVALFFAYRVSPVNQVGFLDPWLYAGYINNFGDLVARYGLTYYSVRFGLIFPHLLLAKLLGPYPGYLAFCYLLYLLAGVPVYLLFRKRYSIEAAVLAYALLVSSAWFARTVLWTHPDAAAVPYTLAGVSLLLLDPVRRAPACFAAGLLFGLAANCNLFAVSIAGLSGAAYLILHAGALGRRLAGDIACMLGGFAAAFAMGAIGYLSCCGTPDFIRPTWEMVVWSFSGAAEVYRVPYPVLFRTFFYIYLPLLLAAALALSARTGPTPNRVYLAAAGYFLAALWYAAWLQFTSRVLILDLFYYYAYLFPPFFLCCAMIAVRLGNEGGPRRLLWIATAVLLLPLLHAHAVLDFTSLTLWESLAISGIILAAIAAGRQSAAISLIGALSFAAAFNLQWNVTFDRRANIPDPRFYDVWGTSNRTAGSAYRIAVRLLDWLPKFRDDGREILFWYTNSDRLMNSLQSTYLWGYSRLQLTDMATSGLPELTPHDVQKLRTAQRGWLVLMDRSRKTVDAGVHTLAEHGVVLGKARSETLCEMDLCVALYIGSLDRKRGTTAATRADIPDGRRETILFNLQTPKLLPALQQNGYGLLWNFSSFLSRHVPAIAPPWPLVERRPEGYLVLHASTPRDHLATEFVAPRNTAAGGTAKFILRVGLDRRFLPAPTCRIVIQNNNYETLFEQACRDPDDPALVISQEVVDLKEVPEKVRVLFYNRDGLDTPLPVRVELAQRLANGS